MNISIIKIINIHTLFISEYMYMQNLVKIYSLIKNPKLYKQLVSYCILYFYI